MRPFAVLLLVWASPSSAELSARCGDSVRLAPLSILGEAEPSEHERARALVARLSEALDRAGRLASDEAALELRPVLFAENPPARVDVWLIDPRSGSVRSIQSLELDAESVEDVAGGSLFAARLPGDASWTSCQRSAAGRESDLRNAPKEPEKAEAPPPKPVSELQAWASLGASRMASTDAMELHVGVRVQGGHSRLGGEFLASTVDFKNESPEIGANARSLSGRFTRIYMTAQDPVPSKRSGLSVRLGMGGCWSEFQERRGAAQETVYRLDPAVMGAIGQELWGFGVYASIEHVFSLRPVGEFRYDGPWFALKGAYRFW